MTNRVKRKLNIGIARTSEISIVNTSCDELDIGVEFIRGLMIMFSEHNIIIKSPINDKEEKIYNNRKSLSRFVYLRGSKYSPYINNEQNKLDVLFVLNKKDKNKKHFIDNIGTTYERHIEEVLEENPNTICIYLQTDDVPLDINTKNKVIILFNSSEENMSSFITESYVGKNYDFYSYNLNELIFNQKVFLKENFFHRVGIFNANEKLDYDLIKNPNSVNEGIYSLTPINVNDNNNFIEEDVANSHSILIEKLEKLNFVIYDNRIKSSKYYDPYFYFLSNYTHVVLIDENYPHESIKFSKEYYYDYENINNYYLGSLLRPFRMEIKKYFKGINLKSKINKLF